jgi:YVTN family beta-propeller protein
MRSVSKCAAGMLVAIVILSGIPDIAISQPAETTPLQLESKIALGDIHGRIDHLAIDLKRQRLFVAELGNNSVGVIDLANGKVIHTITDLKGPQGIRYCPAPISSVAVKKSGFRSRFNRARLDVRKCHRPIPSERAATASEMYFRTGLSPFSQPAHAPREQPTASIACRCE